MTKDSTSDRLWTEFSSTRWRIVARYGAVMRSKSCLSHQEEAMQLPTDSTPSEDILLVHFK